MRAFIYNGSVYKEAAKRKMLVCKKCKKSSPARASGAISKSPPSCPHCKCPFPFKKK